MKFFEYLTLSSTLSACVYLSLCCVFDVWWQPYIHIHIIISLRDDATVILPYPIMDVMKQWRFVSGFSISLWECKNVYERRRRDWIKSLPSSLTYYQLHHYWINIMFYDDVLIFLLLSNSSHTSIHPSHQIRIIALRYIAVHCCAHDDMWWCSSCPLNAVQSEASLFGCSSG